MRIFFESLIYSIFYTLDKSHYLVRFDNNIIKTTDSKGKTVIIPWDDLEIVAIHIDTISILSLRGWSLSARNSPKSPSEYCHFPIGTNGERKLLAEMQKKLYGFNQSAYKKARKSRANKESIVLWKRGMIHQEIFLESVSKHFSFLVDDFGFSATEPHRYNDDPNCLAAFRSKSCYVEIEWFLMGSLNLSVCKILSNGKPATVLEHGESEFYLSELVKYHEPQNDHKGFIPKIDFDNPDLEMLDEKIGIYADLLQKYGAEILSGHNWFKSKTKELISENY